VQYARSDNARDISVWTQKTTPAGHITYPFPFVTAGGDIYLFFRDGDAGGTEALAWRYVKSTDSGDSWSAKTSVISDGDGVGPLQYNGIYWDGSKIHIAPMYVTGTDRLHAYYLYFDTDDDKCYEVDSTEISLPVTKEWADANILAWDSGASVVNHAAVTVKSDGTPCMIVVYGSDVAAEYRYVTWSGSEWTSADITGAGTDSNFDMPQIRRVDDDNLEALLIRGPSSQTAHGSSHNTIHRGGAVEKWVSSDGGSTWAYSAVLVCDKLAGFDHIHLVRNAENYMVTAEWTWDMDDFTNKIIMVDLTTNTLIA